MKVHPIKLPLFAYGTLMPEKKYAGTLEKYRPKVCQAFTLGTLSFVPYKDEHKRKSVTVALDPVGTQRVEGQLLTFDDSVANRALADSDEKEFNFDDLSNREKKERVFIRTIISCFNLKGEVTLAWAYIYVPLDGENHTKVPVNFDNEPFATVRYRGMKYSEYQQLARQIEALNQIQRHPS